MVDLTDINIIKNNNFKLEFEKYDDVLEFIESLKFFHKNIKFESYLNIRNLIPTNSGSTSNKFTIDNRKSYLSVYYNLGTNVIEVFNNTNMIELLPGKPTIEVKLDIIIRSLKLKEILNE